MVSVDLYSAIITKVSNVLNTLVSGEKPDFQALSKGLIVLLCAEVVWQGVPDHGAVHSECVIYPQRLTFRISSGKQFRRATVDELSLALESIMIALDRDTDLVVIFNRNLTNHHAT